jgi:L-lactate dehydrogenase complex protein LldG
MLARIRRANALAASQPAPPGSPPADDTEQPRYRTQGERGPAELLDLLAERLTDYRATVLRASPAELAGVVTRTLAKRGVRRLLVAKDLEFSLTAAPGPPQLELVIDDGLDTAGLDTCDGTVTAAAVAVAETGTIVLDGGPGQGRRAISLIPDYHLCIVHAGQVVELVPEAVARLAGRATRPLTWISGPSATSDIELRRVEGVHGPRTLDVVLVERVRGR